ncbi:MAG: hypothetical protein LBT90_00085 [Holosporaceae bacterium]|nr:hypothetical protein [Holosporaceae bacterium]
MRFKKFVFCFVLIVTCSVHVAEGVKHVLKELPNTPFAKALSVISLSSTAVNFARVGLKKGFNCFKPVAHCVAGGEIVRDIPPKLVSKVWSSRPVLVTKALISSLAVVSAIIELCSGSSKDVWSAWDYVEVGSLCYNIASNSVPFLLDVVGACYAAFVFRPAFSEAGHGKRESRIGEFRVKMADILIRDQQRTENELENYAKLLGVIIEK